ncbi:hypothetical protein [Streptomyces sp. SP2-10]|uniref:hypothetical protein n=1 Tax=Streptomyces sp. SP2-10 TaxID=2873385 RepID=UPI001CA64348|nr:hypothetical protein [Streptomyces sp. SP2-10]MBY8840610.1 hypothetical protein [Streptomyces sp. SP2-10]
MLPEGVAEGRGVGVAVRVGGLGRRLLEGRGVGFSFAGGGALVVAATGGRETGDLLRAGCGSGRRILSLLRSRTPFRAGCVGTRSGEAGESVMRTSGSAGGGSGTDAARGAAEGRITEAVASPPRMVKAAAARDWTAYFRSRDGRSSYRSATKSCTAVGGPGRGNSGLPGSPLERTTGIAASTAGAPSLRSLGCPMPESNAPHSGQVTAPLSVRLQGMQ